MPDIIEPPPAEVTPPAAPPGAAPAPEVVPENVKKLMSNLFDEPERAPEKKPDEPEKKPSAAAPDPKAPAKPGEKPTEPPAPPAPADPGMRLRKPKVSRPELPLVKPPAPPAPVAPEESYKPDPQWERGLSEEQREMMSDAADAERLFPEKHKGLAARTAKFLKDHAAETQRPDFDAESPQYKAWVEKNQPRLSRSEIRELEEGRITHRVRGEYDTKLTELNHRLFQRDTEPKIEQQAKTIYSELANSSLPDDIVEAFKSGKPEEVQAKYALELETAQNVLVAATEDIKEFIRITTRDPDTKRPLQEEVTDPSHPKYAQHQRLNQMVVDVGEHFKNNAPAEHQLRNGKWFVTRDEWNSIRPDQRHKFWTFTNAELIDASKKSLKPVIAQAIEARRASMKKYGWQPAAPVAAPATPPKPAPPPVPTNTPRVPAAVPVPGATDPMADIDARTKAMADRLGRS